MLLEQIIANNQSLQLYEYINTEIAEDGHRLVMHLASRKDTAEERCPYRKGHVHILGRCSMRLRDVFGQYSLNIIIVKKRIKL